MAGETEDATREPYGIARELGLTILVVDEDNVERHPLPAHGTVVVGRSNDVDVRIRHPWISRRHALLHIGMRDGDGPGGDAIIVEDAGSSYGVRVRGAPLEKGEKVEIAPGDVVELGSTMLVVQRRAMPTEGTPLRREDLALALREDCERAARLKLELDVVAVELPPGQETIVHEVLVQAHSLSRVVLVEGRCVAAALRPVSGVPLVRRVQEQLSARGIAAAVGSATLPRDGDRPDELIGRALKAFASGEDGVPTLLFADDATVRLRAEIEGFAKTDANVLLEGETGTGKDVLARTLFKLSGSQGELVTIACGRLGDAAYARAAFDRAVDGGPSLVQRAENGALLLDEVGETPAAEQARLVSFIGDGAKVRVLSTTQRDLKAVVQDGSFRRDLFFRLAGAHVVIPPLRARPRDVETLARHFAAQAAARTGKRRVPDLSPELLAALTAYPWPGNVRELKDAIEAAVVTTASSLLKPEDVGPLRQESPRAALDLRAQIAALERQRIIDALDKSGGNQSRAAKLLGMPRNTLLARLREYDLPRPRKSKREG